MIGQLNRSKHVHFEDGMKIEGSSKAIVGCIESLMVGLLDHAASGNIPALEQYANEVFHVARNRKWYQVQALVLSILGASYFREGKYQEALTAFRKSCLLGREVKNSGDTLGAKIEIEARFAEATVLFARMEYQEASDVYVTAASIATALCEPLSSMEAFLMASFCQEILDNKSDALLLAKSSWDNAKKMQDVRPIYSTVACLGETLLRLIPFAKWNSDCLETLCLVPTTAEVEKSMVYMLGKDWKIKAASVDKLLICEFGFNACERATTKC